MHRGLPPPLSFSGAGARASLSVKCAGVRSAGCPGISTCTHQKSLLLASLNPAPITSSVTLEQRHQLSWLCLKQHKPCLHVTTAVKAGRVGFTPGGARRLSGGQHSINKAIIQMKNLKNKTHRNKEQNTHIPKKKKKKEKDQVAGDSNQHCSGITATRSAGRGARAEPGRARSCSAGTAVPGRPCS